MALSTIMPAENASPAMLIILRLLPNKLIKINTVIIQIGMVTATMINDRTDFKKNNNTKLANRAPNKRFSQATSMD